MHEILSIHDTKCTGCGACANKCPVHAIAMQRDVRGFYKPQIDSTICIHCNLCDQVCPVLQVDHNANTPKKTLAVWAEDSVRISSSSGGVFPLLAEEIFRRGGIVFGAAWTEDFHVKTVSAADEKELPPLCRSKYCQSDTNNAYQQVKQHLENKKLVLYVGTPCQIAALKNYLSDNKNLSYLITVDFICYYNPPIDAIRKFLDDNYGLENILDFHFRDKKYGWLSHVYRVALSDGQVHLNRDINNSYFQGYFNALYESDACATCLFSGQERVSDLTLADFWKIEQHDPKWNDGKGTSMVWVNTDIGEAIMNAIRKKCKKIEEVPENWIREGQTNSKRPHKNRDYFYDMLRTKDFNSSVNMALTGQFDVGLVCVQSYENFGSALTNYAMYNTLHDLGHSVLIVTQPMSSKNKPTIKENYIKSPFPQYAVAEHFATQKEMEILNARCNQFMVGSDQLFNYEIYKLIDGFVKLDWVDSNHRKLAYAASFGQDRLLGPKEERTALSQSLKRFSAFSVREESGIRLSHELGINAEQVLDPVFLCNINHYMDLILNSNIAENTGGLFCYILDPSEKKEEAIRTIAKKTKLSPFVVTDRWRSKENVDSLWKLETTLGVKNEDWLAAIKNAEYVITDSFHGMCFAIIFKKPFLVLANKMRGATRFYSLAKLLGLESNVFDTEEELSAAVSKLNKLNFSHANEILKCEKERSIKWLNDQMLSPYGMQQRENDVSIEENNIMIPVSPKKIALTKILQKLRFK